MAAHDLPEFDPAIIERYVENTYRKAQAVFMGSVVAGVMIGAVFGATPLTSLGESWPIPRAFGFATMLLGALFGGVIGYLIGDTRSFLARLQGQTALAQIQAAKDARHALEAIAQIQALATRRVASEAAPRPEAAPVSPAPAPVAAPALRPPAEPVVAAAPAPVAAPEPPAPDAEPAPAPAPVAPAPVAPAPVAPALEAVPSPPAQPAPPTLVVADAAAAPEPAPPLSPPTSA